MTRDELGFAIDLTVRNEWDNVDLLRTSVQNCFTAVFADVDGCHAISMVTGELLENALKYGDWTSSSLSLFRLRIVGRAGDVEVSVENPIKADDENAGELMRQIAQIDSFDKPELAYRARLLEIAEDEGDESPSRLGLARVAFEGNCRLSAKLANGTVTVSALLMLPAS